MSLENSLQIWPAAKENLELRQGFVTKMYTPVSSNMWTPAMTFATWHVPAGPSSQYGHILCCIQGQNSQDKEEPKL